MDLFGSTSHPMRNDAGSALLALSALALAMGNVASASLALAMCSASFGLSASHTSATPTDNGDGPVIHEEPVVHGNTGVTFAGRAGNEHRDRCIWEERLDSMSPKKFRSRFKLNRKRFNWLADKIAPHFELDQLGHDMACLSSGSPIPVRCRLAAALRYLAGSDYKDIEDLYGIGTSTVYDSLWRVLAAIDYELDLDSNGSWNPTDVDNLERLAQGMKEKSKDTMTGCVGALDGMAVRIRRPSLKCTANPQHYMNRKGFYSVNLQAICDCSLKIIWFSLATPGGTHDSLAFKMSSLGEYLDKNPLPYGYYIAADEAYVCSSSMITPYPSQQTGKFKAKDNFNFYLSRCRINIECAFGVLVERFGCLRRALRGTLEHTSLIVSVCIKLHNLCIHDGMRLQKRLQRDSQKGDGDAVKQDRVADAEDTQTRKAKRRMDTSLRDIICEDLAKAGLERPLANRIKRNRRS